MPPPIHAPRFAIVALLLTCGCGDGGGADVDAGFDAGPPELLRILVTNDDGVSAEGIDAVIQALSADPRNMVVVCAPENNRSGSGDKTVDTDPGTCGDGAVTSATTLSGYAATAINGCPADAVLHALANLYTATEPPHLVVSGLNEGQNVSIEVNDISGTVGAAKVAARNGIPGLASSQGHTPDPSTPDYPAGVTAVTAWVNANRSALLMGGVGLNEITSLNIPSCTAGAVRGAEAVPSVSYMAPPGYSATQVIIGEQDCLSTLLDPVSDLEAFFNGFVSSAQVPID